MKYKCFMVKYDEDVTTYVIGKKTKTQNIKCGTLMVDGEGNVKKIHVHYKKKDNINYPLSLKRDVLYKWAEENDLTISQETEVYVRVKRHNRNSHTHSNSYTLWEEWFNN